MSSRSAKRKDLVGAGTSQEDSKDLLSGKVHSVANHKLFAKPLLYLLMLSILNSSHRCWWSYTHTLRQVKFDYKFVIISCDHSLELVNTVATELVGKWPRDGVG